MPTQKTVIFLKYGDRFYYLSDTKKTVWQVDSVDTQIIKLRGFVTRVRLVTLRNESNKVVKQKFSKMDTHVVYLRNILEDAVTTI